MQAKCDRLFHAVADLNDRIRTLALSREYNDPDVRKLIEERDTLADELLITINLRGQRVANKIRRLARWIPKGRGLR